MSTKAVISIAILAVPNLANCSPSSLPDDQSSASESSQNHSDSQGPTLETLGAVSVVDGDTVIIGSTEYRFDGVDAPEAGAKCAGFNVYDAATAALTEITGSNEVECEPTGKKNRDRWIATCFVLDADGTRTNLSEAMVGLGWARDWPKFSNGKYADMESLARTGEAGIWGLKCPDNLWRNRDYD